MQFESSFTLYGGERGVIIEINYGIKQRIPLEFFWEKFKTNMTNVNKKKQKTNR